MVQSNFSTRIVASGDWFARAANQLQSPLLLAVRLYWGWQFAQTGWGKLHNLSKIAGYFASLHIPAPAFTAYFIAGLEFFGGLLLIVGLASRLAGLLLACNMFAAYLIADPVALRSILSDPGKFYNADPYTFLFASLLILIFGPGRLALDHLISVSFRPTRRDPASSGAGVPSTAIS
jgi:putative oxidoreductase